MNTKFTDSYQGLTWECVYDPQTTKSSGDITVDTLNAFTPSVMAFANPHKPKGFLIDHSMANFKLSIMEIYSRPEIAEEMGVTRKMLVALVLSPDAERETHFGETVFVTRGFEYHIFHSRDEGETWLLENI